MEILKDNVKKVGSWLLDKIFYYAGMILYILFCAVRSALEGVIGLFVGGFYILVLVGAFGFIFCFIIVILGHVFFGH